MDNKYLEGCNSSIVLLREDLSSDAWEHYCKRFDIPFDAEKIIIWFNDRNMDYEHGKEEKRI